MMQNVCRYKQYHRFHSCPLLLRVAFNGPLQYRTLLPVATAAPSVCHAQAQNSRQPRYLSRKLRRKAVAKLQSSARCNAQAKPKAKPFG
ncbi:hypothetical protein NPIL_39621 [Nephila pilipes]|uniref:Uncharacterized protein n=1 Tax=Nephila pilipes TaxID=299642 RepID=A0A8X6URS8_NEPPI|nr:hypothetical protein NPIL_39621 [Nephila pilipes]